MDDVAMEDNSPEPGGKDAAKISESTEVRERRASIKAILADDSMTPLERRRSIQSLMDGRRRSSVGRSSITSNSRASGGMSMAAAAAAAAAAFDYDSDEDDEDNPPDDDSSNGGGGSTGRPSLDRRLSRSSITSRSSRRVSRTPSYSSVGSAQNSTHSTLISAESANGDPDIVAQQHSLAVQAAMAHYENSSGRSMELSRQMEAARPECSHYDRNCTLVSPCCGMAFGCRICHDDSSVLPPPIFDMQREMAKEEEKRKTERQNGSTHRYGRSASMPDIAIPEVPEHHNIDRFAVTEVICRACFTRQSSKTNNCIKCHVKFGDYHCNVCNLWMSDEERPYHCTECGFCRVGGQENFRHCFDCGMCIDAYLFDDHNCKVGKYMSNCPVCQEDLFSSRSASHEMPCGHAIHWHCFRELTSFDSRCPVCKKTAESHERMAPTWSAMAMGIALQPVPPELARVVTICCTDCEEQEENRRWHFLGVQCRNCTSFNTVIEDTTMTGPEAHAYLAEIEGSDDTRAVLSAAMEASREVGNIDVNGGADMEDDEDLVDHHDMDMSHR